MHLQAEAVTLSSAAMTKVASSTKRSRNTPATKSLSLRQARNEKDATVSKLERVLQAMKDLYSAPPPPAPQPSHGLAQQVDAISTKLNSTFQTLYSVAPNMDVKEALAVLYERAETPHGAVIRSVLRKVPEATAPRAVLVDYLRFVLRPRYTQLCGETGINWEACRNAVDSLVVDS